MQVETSIFNNCVLQRNGSNVSEAFISGTTNAVGAVVVQVSRGGRVLAGFRGKQVGQAKNGRFEGWVTGVPVGGPYRIEMRVLDAAGKIADHAAVTNVLVGDVWLLAGQSNMEGVARRSNALPTHPMVRAFFMDDHWGVARDPLHALWAAVDKVHAIIGCPTLKKDRYVGPGMAFAQEMWRLTRVPQGLIAAAHGGTSMEQWNPARKDEGTNSLYGAALRRIQKNGGRIAGVAWYQGESDCGAQQVDLYTSRMRELVAALRHDCNHALLPFVAVQISRVVETDVNGWNIIREQQRQLPQSIDHLALVPAIDLTLDDAIHIGGSDINRLGRRMAQAMGNLRGDKKAHRAPIRLKSIEIGQIEDNGAVEVVAAFADVVGKLVASGRPVGFTVVNDQRAVNVVDVKLQGSKARILTRLTFQEAAGAAIYYGYGCNPVCNITDEADRSIPAFGPLRLSATQ